MTERDESTARIGYPRRYKLPRYLDTGSDNANECLGEWLNANLMSGVRSFRGQFGYFGINALLPYEQTIADIAQVGGTVRFVLGANDGDLSAADVRGALRLVENTANGSLIVVRYDNALFHPKTLHLVRQDGSESAVVGSANFTKNGLGLNVEAMIVLDTSIGDDSSTISEIADAIDKWNGVTSNGVFPVRNEQEVVRLIAGGIIGVTRVRRPSTSIKLRSTQSTLGTRKSLWTRPTSSVSLPTTPRLGRVARPNQPIEIIQTSFWQWCKQLSSSDAQQVTSATNPTGKLRLSKAGFLIDHRNAFRQEMFANQAWQTRVQRGKAYEIVEVDFDVVIRGNALGTLRLTIDHAPHRIAGQNNVPTILAWGLRLNQLLRATNYVGDWVMIERDTQGRFHLSIQSAKPSWSP